MPRLGNPSQWINDECNHIKDGAFLAVMQQKSTEWFEVLSGVFKISFSPGLASKVNEYHHFCQGILNSHYNYIFIRWDGRTQNRGIDPCSRVWVSPCQWGTLSALTMSMSIILLYEIHTVDLAASISISSLCTNYLWKSFPPHNWHFKLQCD